MGNFIQIDPRMFDRGPRTSMLVGQAIGNTAQKAGDLFLQGKVQNMLARGQQRESAKGIASLYPREYQKQVEDAYSQVPLAYHGEGIKQAQEFMGAPGIDFSSGVPSSFLGRVGPTPMQPPQMQQPAQRAMYAPESMLEGPKPVQVEEKTQPPTSTAVAANIDALQRMGQGLPVANQQGQANVAANQFPPASGAQQPQAQPQPENIPLEDLTAPEVNGLLRMIPKKSDRDAFIKDVERAKKNSRAERDVSAREGKNIQSEKTFQYNKKQKEIDRAEENTKKFREGLSAKEETLPQRQQALDITIDAIQRGSLGPLSINHLASMFGMYGEDAKQLLSGVKTSLLSDLSPIGGKQNVYLEQMMAGSLPQIGTTQSGNLIATDIAQSKIDIDRAYVEAYNEVKNKYLNDPQYGYFPEKGVAEVQNVLRPRLEQIRKNTFFKLQEDREYGMTHSDLAKNLKQPFPTPLTNNRQDALLLRAKAELTKAQNGKPPTPEQVMGYAKQLAQNNNFIVE